MKLKSLSGVGWDPSKNTILASKQTWDELIQSNKSYKEFQHNGFPLYKQMFDIIGGNIATGEIAAKIMEEPDTTTKKSHQTSSGHKRNKKNKRRRTSGDNSDDDSDSSDDDSDSSSNSSSSSEHSNYSDKKKAGSKRKRNSNSQISDDEDELDEVDDVASNSENEAPGGKSVGTPAVPATVAPASKRVSIGEGLSLIGSSFTQAMCAIGSTSSTSTKSTSNKRDELLHLCLQRICKVVANMSAEDSLFVKMYLTSDLDKDFYITMQYLSDEELNVAVRSWLAQKVK